MEFLLESLYESVTRPLADSTGYAEALSHWNDLNPPLDWDDTASTREYEWGYLCFLAGLRLGLETGQAFSGIWMNLS